MNLVCVGVKSTMFSTYTQEVWKAYEEGKSISSES